MSRKPKNATATIVGSTTDTNSNDAISGADVVTLRVSLRRGYAIDDVPDGAGSTKTVVLPGLDANLRGAKQGILTPDGNAVFIQLPRVDWEFIKQVHGKERMFNSYQGKPACVAEVKSLSAAKSGAYNDEIKETATGYAPKDPAKLGVHEAKSGE